MFMKAFMAATYPVLAAGTASTMGSIGPLAIGYPFGCASMPAKIVASMTEIKVNTAEAVAPLDSALKVRGSEHTHDMHATMAEKPMVHIEWLVMVFKYLAPTKQCRPYSA